MEEIKVGDYVRSEIGSFGKVTRIEDNKLTYRYSERLFKNHKLLRMFYPKYVKKIKSECTKYKDKNYYLLCASAYAERDYNWFGAFKNKCFKYCRQFIINKFQFSTNFVIFIYCIYFKNNLFCF